MKIEQIINLTDEELLLRLGAVNLAQSAQPGSVDDPAVLESDRLVKLLEEEEKAEAGFLKRFGGRILKHASEAAYETICRDGDKNITQKLELAKDTGKVALATQLLGILISMGFDPASAALLAALIASVLLRAGEGAICEIWADYNSRL